MRRAIDDWLDTRSAGSLPSEVAVHIRECASCRSYITAWNAVELQFRSVKDEWPTAQDVRAAWSEWDTRDGLDRWKRNMAHGGRRWSPMASWLWARPLRVASVAAAVVTTVGLALYMTHYVRSNASLAKSGVTGQPFGVEAMEAIRRDAPVAATR